MGSKRVGLARTQALIENLKRELSLNGSGLNGINSLALSSESVEGGNGAGNATALSPSIPISFCATDTSKSHVSLAAGAAGAIKIIVHTTRANSTNLVITPASFTAGTNLTSNAAGIVIILISDGTNWHTLETAGYVIG